MKILIDKHKIFKFIQEGIIFDKFKSPNKVFKIDYTFDNTNGKNFINNVKKEIYNQKTDLQNKIKKLDAKIKKIKYF